MLVHKFMFTMIISVISLFLGGCMGTVDVEKKCPHQRVCLVCPTDNNSHGVFVKDYSIVFKKKESIEFHRELVNFSANYVDSLQNSFENSFENYPSRLMLNFLSSVEGIPAHYDADHVNVDLVAKNTYASVLVKDFPQKIEIWTDPSNEKERKVFKYLLFFNEAKKEYDIVIER